MLDKRFSEETVVKKLIEKFEEFSSYYKNERAKIKSEIIWVKTDKLAKGITARTTSVDGKRYIYIRKLPYSFSDAQLIAHELQHIVHDDHNKVPGVGTYQGGSIHDLSSAINSSVHDQLVNRDLIKYDFDICTEFEDEIVTSKKDLATIKNEPDNDFGITHWAVNYASKKIDYDFVTNEYEFEDSSFFDWFNERYPNVLERSNQIYSALKQIDLDSNDSMKNYFSWILLEYNLGKHIFLIK